MNWISNKKTVIVCALIMLAGLAIELWPAPSSCCRRKQHATSTVALKQINNRPAPDPNCAHGRMIAEMRRKGRLKFYGQIYAGWAAGFFSSPTLPPDVWDMVDCSCPESCLL